MGYFPFVKSDCTSPTLWLMTKTYFFLIDHNPKKVRAPFMGNSS